MELICYPVVQHTRGAFEKLTSINHGVDSGDLNRVEHKIQVTWDLEILQDVHRHTEEDIKIIKGFEEDLRNSCVQKSSLSH